MDDHELSQIFPEDTLKILLPAKQIPHGSTVTKKTGTYRLTLNHRIRIFVPRKDENEEMASQEIVGYFLQGAPQADLNQIKPDTELHWHVGAEEFADYLEKIWVPTPK